MVESQEDDWATRVMASVGVVAVQVAYTAARERHHVLVQRYRLPA